MSEQTTGSAVEPVMDIPEVPSDFLEAVADATRGTLVDLDIVIDERES